METTQQQKDELLWKLAEKRARFKKHLTTYIIMNSFFWGLWFFSENHHSGLPWPVWPMAGWGLGLAFQYFDAFHDDKVTNTQKEYEKLKREKEGM